jgi:hypothetical protein
MSDSSKISEAVFLAVISSLSYAMAYAYRAGYASHFGFPLLSSTPSLGLVIQSAGAIGASGMIFWFIAYFSWPYAPQGNSTSDRRTRIIMALILSASAIFFQVSDDYFAWAGGYGALLLFFAIILGCV